MYRSTYPASGTQQKIKHGDEYGKNRSQNLDTKIKKGKSIQSPNLKAQQSASSSHLKKRDQKLSKKQD